MSKSSVIHTSHFFHKLSICELFEKIIWSIIIPFFDIKKREADLAFPFSFKPTKVKRQSGFSTINLFKSVAA